jgi:hypothetical protein
MRFVAALASGLETRNQFANRQEKNEFNFRSRPKIFLDWKMQRAFASQKANDRGSYRIFD